MGHEEFLSGGKSPFIFIEGGLLFEAVAVALVVMVIFVVVVGEQMPPTRCHLGGSYFVAPFRINRIVVVQVFSHFMDHMLP